MENNKNKEIVWPEKKSDKAWNFHHASGWNQCHDAFMKVINSTPQKGRNNPPEV